MANGDDGPVGRNYGRCIQYTARQVNEDDSALLSGVFHEGPYIQTSLNERRARHPQCRQAAAEPNGKSRHPVDINATNYISRQNPGSGSRWIYRMAIWKILDRHNLDLSFPRSEGRRAGNRTRNNWPEASIILVSTDLPGLSSWAALRAFAAGSGWHGKGIGCNPDKCFKSITAFSSSPINWPIATLSEYFTINSEERPASIHQAAPEHHMPDEQSHVDDIAKKPPFYPIYHRHGSEYPVDRINTRGSNIASMRCNSHIQTNAHKIIDDNSHDTISTWNWHETLDSGDFPARRKSGDARWSWKSADKCHCVIFGNRRRSHLHPIANGMDWGTAIRYIKRGAPKDAPLH
jgi:hypothetical protein